MKKLNLILALLFVNMGLFAKESKAQNKLFKLPIREEIRDRVYIYQKADFSDEFGV